MDYYDIYDYDFYDYGYGSYGYSNQAMATIGGIYLAFMIAILAFWIFTLAIRWKMFEKAGIPGWKSIIPIYGDYIEYTIVWEGKWFWYTLLAGVGAVIAFFLGFFLGILVPYVGWLFALIGTLAAVAAFVFLEIISVVFYLQEAKAYGQGTGFALGLIFLPFVFKFFLGFDQDIVYRGPQPSPKFFGTVRQQLPGGQAAYQPVQPNTYQQAYGQPQYYAPQAAPVAPQAAPAQAAPVAPQAAPAQAAPAAPAVAPVAPTAPIPQATAAPEAAPELAPEASDESEADDEPIAAPSDGTVPVPHFDPETGLPLQ